MRGGWKGRARQGREGRDRRGGRGGEYGREGRNGDERRGSYSMRPLPIGLDLETVQRLYEKQKTAPPAVRNAPPVSASIMWARQLMRRIEEPMNKFGMNKNLMGTKE